MVTSELNEIQTEGE